MLPSREEENRQLPGLHSFCHELCLRLPWPYPLHSASIHTSCCGRPIGVDATMACSSLSAATILCSLFEAHQSLVRIILTLQCGLAHMHVKEAASRVGPDAGWFLAGCRLTGRAGGSRHVRFDFDAVFGPTATQDDVYLEAAPVITSVLDGYHVCMFAYGDAPAFFSAKPL